MACRRKNLDDMGRLRWIQIASSGFEHLVPLHLPAQEIRASNARGVFDIPIAEWCIAMMVNLTRDLPQLYRNQQAGHWDRDARFQTEIRGRTVGLWGYGGLARETARLAKALGLRVHVLARSGVRPQTNIYCVAGTGDPEGTLPDAVFRMEDKAAFLGSLDFLVMALPLNEQTRGIVTGEDLRALPPSAFVLNPARGPLIQEAALLTGPAGRLDCRGRVGHALPVPHAVRPPSLDAAKRDHDAPYLRIHEEYAVFRASLGSVCAECHSIRGG